MIARARAGLAVLALHAAACGFTVDYGGTEYQCPTGECPPGFECRNGTCVPEGTPIDAGADAGPTGDGGLPDAGGTAACGTTARLVDDFDDGIVSSDWGTYTATGASVSERDGQLVIAVAADSGDAWAGFYSRHVHDLTGSHARVRVDQVGPRFTVLEVRRRDDAKAQVVESNGNLEAAVYGLPDGNGVRNAVPYDADAHRWWRIREADGTMFWEVSADGDAWVILHQEANPFSPQLVAVVLTAGGQLATAGEARMDDFNPDGDPAQPWCSISGLRDDFDDGAEAEEWGDSWETAGCTRAETGGEASIAFDGTADAWCGFESLPVYDACSGQVSIQITAPLDATESEMWLNVYLPDGRFSFALYGGSLRALEDSETTTLSSSFSYDPDQHRWWRIRTDGASTHWETSPDGVAWTAHESRPITLDCGTAFVGFGAGLWTGWTAGATEVAFDDFNATQ